MLGRYREALAEFETAAALACAGEGVAAADDAEAGKEAATAIAARRAIARCRPASSTSWPTCTTRLGDWDLAKAHLAVVTELVADAEPGRLARAEADRAVVAYRRGDAERAAVFGQAALSCARAAADRGATAQTLNVLGMLAARAGDAAAAETYLRDSLAEARQLPELGAAWRR